MNKKDKTTNLEEKLTWAQKYLVEKAHFSLERLINDLTSKDLDIILFKHRGKFCAQIFNDNIEIIAYSNKSFVLALEECVGKYQEIKN